MPLSQLLLLLFLFLVTSSIGVVTGSNSLITVPVMFEFGIDEKVAVATNMFGLTFMSIGATIPFLRSGTIEPKRLTPMVLITVAGSAIGAALVGVITNQGIKFIVSAAMIAVGIFIVVNRRKGVMNAAENSGKPAEIRQTPFVLLLVFALAVYGGLYSGGYVTLLTAAFVAFANMTYKYAVAATKYLNVFSSAIATAVFMWQGLVDYRLGVMLAAVMFAGAYIGAHFVTKLNDVVLKWIFLSTVFLLALKLISDLI